jgi:hypothetical protein
MESGSRLRSKRQADKIRHIMAQIAYPYSVDGQICFHPYRRELTVHSRM